MSEREPNLKQLPSSPTANDPPIEVAIEVAADDIQRVAQVELQRTTHDDAPLGENNALEIDRIKLELDDVRQAQAEAKDVHKIRKAYVLKLFCLIVGWLIVTGAFLAFAGFHAWGFSLSEKVLIALITSTTANVLGLFYVVAKWLYPSPAGKEVKSRKVTAELSRSGEG